MRSRGQRIRRIERALQNILRAKQREALGRNVAKQQGRRRASTTLLGIVLRGGSGTRRKAWRWLTAGIPSTPRVVTCSGRNGPLEPLAVYHTPPILRRTLRQVVLRESSEPFRPSQLRPQRTPKALR
jgi:hypothetical protein